MFTLIINSIKLQQWLQILIFINCYITSNSLNSFIVTESNTNIDITCIKRILFNIYTLDTTVFICSDTCPDIGENLSHNFIIFSLENLNQEYFTKKTRRMNYVIISYTLEEVVDATDILYRKLKKGYKGNVLITLLYEANYTKVFQHLWSIDAYNVHLAICNKTIGSCNVLWAHPFQEYKNCGRNVTVYDLGDCLHFSPMVLAKQYKSCPYVAMVLNFVYDKPYYKTPDDKGILIEPVKLFCERLKLKLAYGHASIENQLVYLYDPHVVNNKSVDTVVSPLFMDVQSHTNFFSTHSILQDPYIWLVPIPNPVSHLLIFLLPYSEMIWALWSFLVLIMITLFWKVARRTNDVNYHNLSQSAMAIYGVSFLNPAHHFPSSNTLKGMMMCHMLFSLIFCNLYQGTLVSIFTVPVLEKGIRNAWEMAESDLPLLGHEYVLNNMKLYTDSEFVKIMLGKSISTSINAMMRMHYVAEFKNASTAVMKATLLADPITGDDVRNIGSFTLLAATPYYPMRIGHPLFEDINTLLSRIFESGFNTKFLLDNEETYFIAESATNISLTLYQIVGAFVTLALGLGLGAFLFICELCYYHCKLLCYRK